MTTSTVVDVTPYDNDVTLLYKWAEIFDKPLRLIIVRPRVSSDNAIKSGTKDLVYETLNNFISRQSPNDTYADVYDSVRKFSPLINENDIIYTYYELTPNISYIKINDIYHDITSKVDEFANSDARLADQYQSWRNVNSNQFRRDMTKLASIKDIQEKLADVAANSDTLFISPINIESLIASFNPTKANKQVITEEDGIDIFNAAIPSRYVPFIKYNNNFGEAFSRVFTGGKIGDEPNFNNTIIPAHESDGKDTLYLQLWLGDPDNDGSGDLYTATQASFYTVIYHLETNSLTIETPISTNTKKDLIKDKNLAYQRVQIALPNIILGKGKEIKVNGEFNIYGLSYDESTLLDMILNEPLMNVYLYVEENNEPFAFKKRLDIHYRSILSDEEAGEKQSKKAYISNFASVSISVKQKTYTENTLVHIYNFDDHTSTTQILDKGIDYVHVNISQAESRETVDKFVPIFLLLLRYYVKNSFLITEEYQKYLPELSVLPQLLEQRGNKEVTNDNEVSIVAKSKKSPKAKKNAEENQGNSAELKAAAPDIFVENYPRICDTGPKPIRQMDIPYWQAKYVTSKQGVQTQRQIITFPKDSPVVTLVCPNDAYPYPGVKINSTLSNKDKYPVLPCCYRKDHISNPRSKYSKYIRGDLLEKTGAKASSDIITRKILLPGLTAGVPREIDNILRTYSNEVVEIKRLGIIYDANSMLHAICTAIDDPNYLNLIGDAAKSDYVARLRTYIANNIYPSLLKQELYDYNDQEILVELKSQDDFLDPALFYRAMEEVFNINLYVFLIPSFRSATKDIISMDIPRFKLFHAHPMRLNRPTVIILKTWGSESDDLHYPHCELIVDFDAENAQIMKIFGTNMTELCHNTLQKVMKTITWQSASPSERSTSERSTSESLPSNQNNNENLIAYDNMYSRIDHLNSVQLPAISQFIDDFGKLRALTFNVGNNQKLSLVTIPSQPENLPTSTKLETISIDTAVKIFNQPKGITRNNDGQVNGLWYPILGITFGEYVPVNPMVAFPELPIGPSNPIASQGVNITNRLRRLRRTLNIIMQLLRWLYEIYKLNNIDDPATFINNYLIVNNKPVSDSANYYNLSRIPYHLPEAPTVEQAIAILSPLAPTLFYNGRIVMYNEDFTEKIRIMIIDNHNATVGNKINPPEFIEGYFENENDFQQVPNSVIFLNLKDLTAWKNSLKISKDTRFYNIRNKIQLSDRLSDESFLYQDTDERIYLVQNMAAGGNKDKAMSTAYIWRHNNYNPGNDPEIVEQNDPYMIYGISSDNKMIPLDDQTNNSNNFLKLLYYGTATDYQFNKPTKYAALLEIL